MKLKVSHPEAQERPSIHSIGFCSDQSLSDSDEKPILSVGTDSVTLSLNPSKRNSFVNRPCLVTNNRVATNARSSFPQPTAENPNPAHSLDNETGRKLRADFLIGKKVKGVLMKRRGGYFIKWNDELNDAVYLTEECVNTQIGNKRQKGQVAIVRCTIEKLGPSYAAWYKQHPSSTKIQLVKRYWNHWHLQKSQKREIERSQSVHLTPSGTPSPRPPMRRSQTAPRFSRSPRYSAKPRPSKTTATGKTHWWQNLESKSGSESPKVQPNRSMNLLEVNRANTSRKIWHAKSTKRSERLSQRMSQLNVNCHRLSMEG